MHRRKIDINCDVGEGIGNEAELFPYISSCSIACGGHAGDEAEIRRVFSLAKAHGIKMGAHPSYPDQENFGRISMTLTKDELIKTIRQQLSLICRVAEEENCTLYHIKPHGALYNDIATDKSLGTAFLEAIEPYDEELVIYTPYGSALVEEAIASGRRIVFEAFGDRAYNNDLSLVSRKQDGSMIESPENVLDHMLRMILKRKVRSIDHNDISIEAKTFCIHGDTPSALQILMYISKELPKHGIYLDK